MAQCNPGELIASSFQFRDLDDRMMRMVIIQLLCDISAASAGGGFAPPPPEPPPETPNFAPPPPGPDPEILATLEAQSETISKQAEEVRGQRETITSLVAEVEEASRVLALIEDRIATVDGSIGTLHESLIAKADRGDFLSFKQSTENSWIQSRNRIEEVLDKASIAQEMVNRSASREELSQLQAGIMGELSTVRDLIPKPVEAPPRKRWYQRLRDFSANLFT